MNTSIILIITLLTAGVLAGAVNFFIHYLELPFPKKTKDTLVEEWPRPKSLILAIVGYIIVGIAGAFLTPLLNALMGLKGYFPEQDFLVAFGYGLVFGYSTVRLLRGVMDGILKRLDILEKTQKLVNQNIDSDNSKNIEFLKVQLTEPVDPLPSPEIAPTTIGGDTKTGRFGCGRIDTNGLPKMHSGIDLKANIGEKVKSIYSGTVQDIRNNKPNDRKTEGLGNYVIIKSNQMKISIKYCHLSEVLVEKGDFMATGQVIGKTGQSGNAYGVPNPHLHLVVSKDYFITSSKYVDPEPYLKTKFQPPNPNSKEC
jgi:hypothetical protein